MQLLANTTSPYLRIARIAMIEKGLDVEPTIVDPWADDARLRAANAATRVPTLVTGDGIPLTESLLIVMWLERKYPKAPSLLGNGEDVEGILSRAGAALGVIDAAVHTIITRKVTAPALFDDTPVGVRRKRTMAEGIARLEQQGAELGRQAAPTLDDVAAVTAIDYLRFRFADKSWLTPLPRLDALSAKLRARPAFAATVPR
jgi:glutathione S-transferase